MKKILDWGKKNKFSILLGLFVVLVILFLYTMFQSLKKDHSMELTTQTLKLKEESRLKDEKMINELTGILKGMNDNFRYLIAKDSSVAVSISQMNERINELKISKQYHEKIKAIDTYNNAQLLQYLRDLPKFPDNDY